MSRCPSYRARQGNNETTQGHLRKEKKKAERQETNFKQHKERMRGGKRNAPRKSQT